MANFYLEGVDDLVQQLENLAELSELAPKMIDAAKPTVAESLKKNIHTATNRGYATGELAESVTATKTRLNNYGYFASVLVSGTDAKGVRNGEKLAYLEYGTSTQTAHPVMKKTVNESNEGAIQKMQDVFNASAFVNDMMRRW